MINTFILIKSLPLFYEYESDDDITTVSYDYLTVKGAKLNGRTGKQVCKNLLIWLMILYTVRLLVS